MSFVIDFEVGHRQNLLNLVSYCNNSSVRKKLSAEKVDVSLVGAPTPEGRYRVKLTNRNDINDAVIVSYTKLQLNDFLDIPGKYLDWFDFENGQPKNYDKWAESAKASVEKMCQDRGMVLSRAWDTGSQCHVEYDEDLERYVVVYECDSFIYSARNRFILPLHIGQIITNKTLDGLNYNNELNKRPLGGLDGELDVWMGKALLETVVLSDLEE